MAVLESTRVPGEPVGARFDAPAVSMEAGLYAGLFFAALAVRLLYLGAAPLASDEAQQALASWRFVSGIPGSFTGSPLLFSGNSFLFALFGATGTNARLLPAFFGAALVLLPAVLRGELGRVGALVASALYAFSPSLVFFSRDLNGVIITATCALGALAFFWRYAVGRLARDLYIAVVFAALALISSQDVWTIVLASALCLVFFTWRLRPYSTGNSSPDEDGNLSSGESFQRQAAARAGLVFIVVLVGVATTFLLRRDGLGAAFDLFGAWVSGLQPGGSIFYPLRLLFVYEPVGFLIGAAALVDWVSRPGENEPPTPVFVALAFWAVVAFVLYSVGSDKDPSHIVTIVVPLTLFAGMYLGKRITLFAEEIQRKPPALQSYLVQELPVYCFALALSIFLYLVLAEFATRGSVLAAELLAPLLGIAQGNISPGLNNLAVGAVILLVIGAIGVLTVSTVGWERGKGVGLALVLTLFAAWTIRQTSLVNFSEQLNVQEWLVQQATSPNVRDLVSDLEDISRWRADDSHTLTIVADDSLGPVVEWYLRSFVNARFEPRPTITPGVQALLLPANTPVNSSGLIHQDYHVETARGPGGMSFLQWLLFRQGAGVEATDVVLWIPQPK